MHHADSVMLALGNVMRGSNTKPRQITPFSRLAGIGVSFAMVRDKIKRLPILQPTHFLFRLK